MRRTSPPLEGGEDDQSQTYDMIATATLTDPAFCVPEHAQGREITRKMVLQWDNSLGGLHHRPQLATWRPVDGHYDIFQSSTRYAPGCSRAEYRRGNLEQAILIGMKIKKVDSNFPCQLGLQIEGVKGNYYFNNGDRYAYLISAKEHSHTLNEIVALTNPYVHSEYLERFPGMTASALRTQGIMPVPGENYVYIDKDHPVVDLMKQNTEQIQINIMNADLIDGRWYKVASHIVDHCISKLDKELVENLPIYDFTNFNARIVRPYGLDWDDQDEICENINQDAMKDRVMNANWRCTVVLEVSYLFM